jgi:predicted branched-subunit amino acid permease
MAMLSLWRDDAWRAELTRGARDMLPAVPGIGAWGLVTGVAMAKSGLSIPLALLMSLAAYAGSAQLAALPLMVAAAPLWVIGVTAIMTNMRFVIYAAAMRASLVAFSPRRVVVLGYLTGDFSFVLFMNRITQEGSFAHRDAFLLGLSAVNWMGWQAGSIAGIVAASFVPTEWGLQFAGTLALLALVVPALKNGPTAAGACVSGAVALARHQWPFRAGLLAGVAAGIAVATLADRIVSARIGAAST